MHDGTPQVRSASSRPLPLQQRFTEAGLDWIVPDWPAPPNVHALSTTRRGRDGRGFDPSESNGEFENARAELRDWVPSEPSWLKQVHGTDVHRVGRVRTFEDGDRPCADAASTRVAGAVCAVRSADCLPVLFCDRAGSVVAAAHAGWRGLSAGILEATIAAMDVRPADLLAWMGPAIGPARFEVGIEVLDAFASHEARDVAAFRQTSKDKWLADLYALARGRLLRAGIDGVHGGELCTYDDPERFYSYRRDRDVGRMATLVWREA